MVANDGSEWPLSKKFGCSSKSAEKLILKAKKLKLDPIGVSFHVGSQQLSIETWKRAIACAANVFKSLSKKDIVLSFLNLGGGMPITYKKSNNNKTYAYNILKSINEAFGNLKPIRIIIEPGRFLVADAKLLKQK